ncbi:flagellar hook capping FlgD N-terminal domain-containing protein [Paenibacillus gansuensis]|uniref:Flagellar hook capping FlgD N-terminal domain-containing protein n=1 Tax=Paenibacillus gansuensis TaxID=306542 RepID=A0ABW5PCE2_9BACL
MADPISTKNIWPNYAQHNVDSVTDSKAGKDKSSLGKDDFLKILVTQLQNQDPSQPLQDREFIAQMAQFSSVEQIMNMAGEMKMLRQSIGMASGLIGKDISWTVTDPVTGLSSNRSGTVQSIRIKDGVQYAETGEEQISLDRITGIRNKEEK